MVTPIWRTLFTDGFDYNAYLYHYTSIDKAIKIINSKQLRFSDLTKTNDLTESKLRVRFVKQDTREELPASEETRLVSSYLSHNCRAIRLICFSKDVKLKKSEKASGVKRHNNHEKDKYFDISGRGFALPRMWAQYASNNTGVCFVIDKKKFDKKLSSEHILMQSSVRYRNSFTCYEISQSLLEALYKKISKHVDSELSFIEMLYKHKDGCFLRYNFFEKQLDWDNEREYRYVALAEISNPDSIVSADNLFDYVEGIVVGEDIDPAYENVISKIVNERCQLRKISFGINSCTIRPLTESEE